MSTLNDFESTLKEVVSAKRLSASKMNRLTEIAMKALQDDAKLVAILYRTHKSLPNSAKVSSLYAFDALARAARSAVTKHGITGDLNSEKGNAATFLLKVEGILEGLFQDMIAIGNPEAKEKTQKVLDIWIKSNTFPSSVLTQLRDMLADVTKESAIKSPPPVQHVAAGAPGNPPIPPISAPLTTASNPDVQSTLLSLLGQAAQATGQNPANSRTPPNNGVATPQLGQAQLALLQRLALTAKLGNGVQIQPSPSTQTSSDQANATSNPSPSSSQPLPGTYSRPNLNPRDPRSSGAGYPERLKPQDERSDDRFAYRGGQRGGFRGRRNRWEGRDGDRFRQRDRDWDPPSRPRDSRSRSPRRFEGRDARRYSPLRRHSDSKEPGHTEHLRSATPEGGKDEFGRDIRPSSVTPPRPISVDDTPTQAPVVPSVVPASAAGPDCRIPVSDQLPSVAANTPAQSTETHASSSATSEQRGLDQFDITTFDATAPSSWEALGNMWKTTYDYVPSQEELMQFILAGGMALACTTGQYSNSQGTQVQQTEGAGQGFRGNGGWRGRGRGNMNGDQGGHGNFREAGQWEYSSNAEHTDAIVLGESPSAQKEEDQCATNVEHPDEHVDSIPVETQTRGGRMQRTGDKWLFVKDLVP
ncbi:hypothetical protein V8B97DRAFT_1932274 [Scleroderma yunnanense]